MSKKIAMLLSLCVLLLLVGCTTPKKLATSEIKELSKELKQQYEQLKRVEVQMQPTRVEWILTWGKAPDDADSLGAFELIRDYVGTGDFKQDVIMDHYMDEYASESEYPSVHITYDMNNDKTFDREFRASYDENEGYKEWYYSKDYHSEGELLK